MSDIISASNKNRCITQNGTCKLILRARAVEGKVKISVLSEDKLKANLNLKIKTNKK